MIQLGEISKRKLERAYYLSENVVELAKDLVGKVLVSNIDNVVSKGIIVETEAYRGYDDKACHANNGKRTKRNEIMYGGGGHAYVYLCYGIHHLFNIVSNKDGNADAVLIRALHPIDGMDEMKLRFASPRKLLTNGPGILTRAMGITTELTGEDLLGNKVWIEKGIILKKENDIVISKRIGVDYAEEDAELPWRFYLRGDPNISKF